MSLLLLLRRLISGPPTPEADFVVLHPSMLYTVTASEDDGLLVRHAAADLTLADQDTFYVRGKPYEVTIC